MRFKSRFLGWIRVRRNWRDNGFHGDRFILDDPVRASADTPAHRAAVIRYYEEIAPIIGSRP